MVRRPLAITDVGTFTDHPSKFNFPHATVGFYQAWQALIRTEVVSDGTTKSRRWSHLTLLPYRDRPERNEEAPPGARSAIGT